MKRNIVWIDLRCVEDNHLHGSGMNLKTNSEGITLAIERNASENDKGRVYAFLMMDASADVVNNEYGGVKW